MTALVLCVLAVLLHVVAVDAATYYVSKSGSDSNACGTALSGGSSARLTINRGIACLSGGDTLIVQAGTYDEIITDYNGIGGYTVGVPSGSAGAYTTIKAETYLGATLILTNVPEGWASILEFDLGRHHIAIENFVINGQFDGPQYGVGLGDATALRFKDLEIKNMKDQGFQGACQACEFLNLHLHHTANNNGETTCGETTCDHPPGQMCNSYCHGVYLTGVGNIFDGGSYHDNDGHGIHMYPGPDSTIIRNVTVYNNVVGIGEYGNNFKIYNNILYHNERGITAGDPGVVAHNTIWTYRPIVWASATFGMHFFSPSATAYNNLVLQQGDDGSFNPIYIQPDEDDISPTGNRLCDPGVTPAENFVGNVCDDSVPSCRCTVVDAGACFFVNAAGGDFRNCVTSPALNTGITLGSPYNIDRLGATRTGTWDAGAYNGPASGVTPVATALQFVVQPTTVAVGASITPSPTVRVVDQFGSLFTESTASITLGLQTNPGASTFGGILIRAVDSVTDVATFPGLTLTHPGVGYTLYADSPGLTNAVSTAFEVTAASGGPMLSRPGGLTGFFQTK